jgi:hypothetical protein
MAALLDCLLKRSVPEAQAFAEALVSSMVAVDTAGDQARALKAASALIDHTPDASWGIIWPAVLSSPDFDRNLIEEVGN